MYCQVSGQVAIMGVVSSGIRINQVSSGYQVSTRSSALGGQRGRARTRLGLAKTVVHQHLALLVLTDKGRIEGNVVSRDYLSCFFLVLPAFWAFHRERPGPNTAKSKDGNPPPPFSRTLFSSGSRRSFILSSLLACGVV